MKNIARDLGRGKSIKKIDDLSSYGIIRISETKKFTT